MHISLRLMIILQCIKAEGRRMRNERSIIRYIKMLKESQFVRKWINVKIQRIIGMQWLSRFNLENQQKMSFWDFLSHFATVWINDEFKVQFVFFFLERNFVYTRRDDFNDDENETFPWGEIARIIFLSLKKNQNAMVMSM